jgi:DHA1 family tetracycline resistance protein-like MFS transporter
VKPLAIIFFTIFIDLLGFGIVIPILPGLVVDDLNNLEYMVGIVAAIPPFMQFIFAPYWGSLSDRKGRRPVILISILISCFAYIIFSFTTTIFILIFSRLLAGIGSGNFSAAQAYVSDISPPEKRAKNMGLIGAAFGLGFILGPPIGGFLKTHYGVWAIGYFTATLCVVNLIFVYFFLPESNVKKQTTANSFKQIFSHIQIALKKRNIRILFLVYALFIAAFSMMQISSPLLWKQQYSFNDKEIGYIFGFIGLCSVIVQGGLVGWFVKTFGEQKMMIIGSVFMCLGLASLPLVPKEFFIPVELIGIMIIALANGLIMPAANALVSKEAPDNQQGTILGAMQSFGSFARTIGPLMSGLLYMIFFALPFLIGSAIMVVCAVLTFRLYKSL